jgi:hypothetical protein
MMRGMTRFEILNEAAKRTLDSAVDAVALDDSGGDHEFGRCTRWLWIGGGGGLYVRMASGAELPIDGATSGSLIPISVSAVLQGTGATLIVALF